MILLVDLLWRVAGGITDVYLDVGVTSRVPKTRYG